ncbi:MAG: hypothetical protein AAB493_00495 [Patescibacteria group bacterium]
MAKKTVVNCTPILWNNDTSPVLDKLYRFPKTIKTQSLYAQEQIGKVEIEKIRDFEIARLVDIDKRTKKYSFVGHKVIKKDGSRCKKNSRRKYFFTVSFSEMKELSTKQLA